jgi:cell division protein FtsQ
MRKFLKILSLIPVLYLILLPAYMVVYTNSLPCRGININIRDSSEYDFITKNELLNLAYSGGTRILGQPLSKVEIAGIEKKIAGLRELKIAEVYMTIDGILNIYADQRTPLMRVFANNGGDYFLDDEGVVIRRRKLGNPRLHIVGGNINISSAMLNGVSVLDTSIKNTILKDIFYLVSYIRDDSFWSAQIDQIYVDNDDEIDIIPRVGNHLVHLGAPASFEGKLSNLEAFYRKVLPEAGWDKYKLINLEFKDQIVCKRR